MEEKTTNSHNTYDELLAITRSDAELHAQFVAVLEDLKDEHDEIRKLLDEFRSELKGHGRETRERLERMERVIDATYLHVSHLAESAVAILKSDREALDAIRAEIEQKMLERLNEAGISIEAGKDVHIKGSVTERANEDKSRQ